MKTLHLDRSMVPDVLRKDYAGTKFRVRVQSGVHINAGVMQWCGGSRSTFSLIELSTGKTRPIVDRRPYPENQIGMFEFEIPTGWVFCEHQTFCGRDHGLIFYVNPDNAAQLLPSADTLDDDSLIVIGATCHLKNSYGGRTDIRFAEASERYGIDRDRWNKARGALISSGHLRKNGSVTPKGRNARSDKFFP